MKKAVKARVLSGKAKKAAPKPVAKRATYEPSTFVWLKKYGDEPRQPALVLYGEDAGGIIIVYVTPKTKGDTGRRDLPVTFIEGRIPT